MQKTKMLKKNYEFRRVLSKGKRFTDHNIDVFILKNRDKSNFLGLAISTKIGKAVVRNKIKRLIRENYKNIEMKIKDGYSMVFLVKSKQKLQRKDVDFYKIKESIEKIFDKAQILK